MGIPFVNPPLTSNGQAVMFPFSYLCTCTCVSCSFGNPKSRKNQYNVTKCDTKDPFILFLTKAVILKMHCTGL